jgi:DNA-binding helix-turn-helix protein
LRENHKFDTICKNLRYKIEFILILLIKLFFFGQNMQNSTFTIIKAKPRDTRFDYFNFIRLSVHLIESRKKMKMTQKEVAEKIGCSLRTVQNIENDCTHASAKYLFAYLYLVSPFFIFNLNEEIK